MTNRKTTKGKKTKPIFKATTFEGLARELGLTPENVQSTFNVDARRRRLPKIQHKRSSRTVTKGKIAPEDSSEFANSPLSRELHAIGNMSPESMRIVLESMGIDPDAPDPIAENARQIRKIKPLKAFFERERSRRAKKVQS